jgi:hypothetical protein
VDGRGGRVGRKLNMVQKYVHVYVNAVMITNVSILGIRRRGIKETGGGGEFKYDILEVL